MPACDTLMYELLSVAVGVLGVRLQHEHIGLIQNTQFKKVFKLGNFFLTSVSFNLYKWKNPLQCLEQGKWILVMKTGLSLFSALKEKHQGFFFLVSFYFLSLLRFLKFSSTFQKEKRKQVVYLCT